MSAVEKKINEFTDMLASNAPAPGGGGAAALCGAVGCALGHMVGALTVGRKKYADVEEELYALMEKAEALQARLLELIDEDARVFEPLAAAYRLPKETPEQQEYKDRVMEQCLYDACSVPLEIMERCADVMDIMVRFAEKGSVMAISDAGCGMALTRGALEAASMNVFINTKSMKDRDEAANYNAKANELLYIYTNKAENIIEMVRHNLK